MSPLLIVGLLALLLGLQPVTTDLYLPALPSITEGFGASMAQAQLTLTALLLPFGLSQLAWGPLSDRFGRRPVLLWGGAAYVAASVGCALAPSMDWLILGRAVQGAAMGAGVMCARAVVRDLYQPVEGARIMSKALTGLGAIACLCAPLGGLLADTLGWRMAMLAVALFGAIALTMIALRFEETVPVRNPRALQPAVLARAWWQILRHPAFLTFSALTAATYLGLFTFLAASSFVLIQKMGFSRTQYGLLMASMSLAYIVGTFICRHLLARHGLRRTVAVGGGLSLAGGTLMGLLALAGADQPWYGAWAIMAPQYLFMIGHGVHQPCGQSGAVGPFPQAAGTASALNGFLMMIGAFAMGHWLGTHMDGTVFPMVYGIWFWSALLALTAWTLVQQHGESGRH